MKSCKNLCLSIALFMLGAISGSAQIQLQPVLSGLTAPVLVTNAKDNSNRLFVVQQNGIIKVLQPGATAPTDFLNIASKIEGGGEKGLLGLAFHPQFAFNRRFYVNYTRDSANRSFDSETVIAEYTALASNTNQADAGSERILLTIPQPFPNHKGGMIEFGKDGFLYIGTGDGGSANDPQNLAQNTSRLLGKFLRINVDLPSGGANLPSYLIPADNPFTGANTARCNGGSAPAGIACQEIYATGLRNPFRWSFDRKTGELYAGDVGQDVQEEISVIKSGKNYGWRVYEGTRCTNIDSNSCGNSSAYEQPIFTYDHVSGRCSVTGGYVYRGRRGTLPDSTYLFADFCTGEIYSLRYIAEGVVLVQTSLLDTNRNIASLGEDENGELYVVGLGGTVDKIINPFRVATRNEVADYDGDLRTDIAVFRGSNRVLYSLNSTDNTVRGAEFGASSDILTPGDFDGDARTDVAVWRPSNGYWYSLDSRTNAFRAFQFGSDGDVPVAGDYDGDRKSDFAVWRPSSGVWFIWQSATNSFRAAQFGANGDQTVPADYDGDGKTDLAVRRTTGGNSTFFVFRSTTNNFFAAQWGSATDVAVPGDYDGDGRADVAVWRPADGFWYALRSGNNQLFARQWGSNGDTPIAGDYDGDGTTDPAVARNSGDSKVWFITQSLNPAIFRAVQFGASSDVTVPNKDVP